MEVDTKRLIRVRSERRARFKRDGYGKKKQLSASWRRPRGLQSKQRAQKKAKGAHPTAGYGSPVAIRVFTQADTRISWSSHRVN